MSSTYRILCLSHDPAIVAVDRDWQSGADGRDAAVRAAQVRSDLDGHERCDLAVGRYSYPLIEVACVGGCPGGLHGANDKWTDGAVLALLWYGHHGTEGTRAAASVNQFRCWPVQRLALLREELGLPNLARVEAST